MSVLAEPLWAVLWVFAACVMVLCLLATAWLAEWLWATRPSPRRQESDPEPHGGQPPIRLEPHTE